MVTKTDKQSNAQSNATLPTLQEQKDAIGQQLQALSMTVTPAQLEKAARKAGITPKTAKYEYLRGKVAILHRGESLYAALLKEIKGKKAAA